MTRACWQHAFVKQEATAINVSLAQHHLMSKIREISIEDFAFDYIRSHYATRTGAEQVLVDKSERTKQGHITDGLFSFLTPEKSLFIAALSTRKSPEIAKILTSFKSNGLGKARFFTATVLFAVAFAISMQVAHLSALYALPVALLLGVVGLAAHSLLQKNRLKTKLEDLLDDLKKAPADEQWLGISISSLTFRNNDLSKHLLQVCQRRGIGVITVGKRAKVVLLQEPQTQICRRGDFLSLYESEMRIRKALLGDSHLRVA